MKTIKLFLTITLVALTTSLFGTITDPNADCNCCPNDLVIEQEMDLEGWMIEPFEASIEYELALENWMAVPFEASIDGDLLLESWMTTPFDTTEELLVEEWMAVAW